MLRSRATGQVKRLTNPARVNHGRFAGSSRSSIDRRRTPIELPPNPGARSPRLDFTWRGRQRRKMSWRAGFAAVLLLALGGAAGAQMAPSVEGGHRAELTGLARRGGSACARHDWDEAVQDFSEALKIAPDDPRLREKLRHALDHRARVREATAARPPPEPPGMSDGERDPGLVPMFKDLRWKARLKREAFEARAAAEAARANPDEKKLAKLRQDAARKKAEENDLTASIEDERRKDAESKDEMEKALGGIQSIGLGPPQAPR